MKLDLKQGSESLWTVLVVVPEDSLDMVLLLLLATDQPVFPLV